MTQAAAQASAFYMEVANTAKVWAIRDAGGFPALVGDEGKRSMPFWSSRNRAENIIKNVPAYKGFKVVELDWETYRDRWLVGLDKDGLNVGVNWSGHKALGYDVSPISVRQNIESLISKRT
jgi:hypothetical protein